MGYEFLSKISSPEDVKNLKTEQLNSLCAEIRDYMIHTVSVNGGHLASNLGTVELTVALHRCFDAPNDTILFDVGHQCYTHKLLTGRFEDFTTLRTEGGISGFMRPDESEYDPFITGHSSNSVSASYGICKAKSLQGKNDFTITVVGDGAMTGGMLYEALNNSGAAKNKFIVVLNDNKMSISKNVGSLARHLSKIRYKKSYHRSKRAVKSFLSRIPLIGKALARFVLRVKTVLKNTVYKNNLFETLGFEYYGPIDGHDINALVNIFEIAKQENRPVFIHTITTKGKGYSFAEVNPKIYHGVSSFDINEGAKVSSTKSFSDIFGETLCEIAKTDKKVCAITAAMSEGTGLTNFAQKYKNRIFDVGIAEQHAATFAAGLAIQGMKPYFAVYSTFLQRSFDQILHDVAILGLPVRLCVDRAGIVGEDGETHQGIFDVAFLSSVPGMQIYSPCYFEELKSIIKKSSEFDFPCAIRYPRGTESINTEFSATDNAFDVVGSGKKAIITYGRIFDNAYKAYNELKNQGYDIAVIKLNKIYPLGDDLIAQLKKYDEIYFFEEGIKRGGIAELIGSRITENNINAKYKIYAIDDTFVPCAKVSEALKKYHLDSDSMIEIIKGEI